MNDKGKEGKTPFRNFLIFLQGQGSKAGERVRMGVGLGLVGRVLSCLVFVCEGETAWAEYGAC